MYLSEVRRENEQNWFRIVYSSWTLCWRCSPFVLLPNWHY